MPSSGPTQVQVTIPAGLTPGVYILALVNPVDGPQRMPTTFTVIAPPNPKLYLPLIVR